MYNNLKIKNNIIRNVSIIFLLCATSLSLFTFTINHYFFNKKIINTALNSAVKKISLKESHINEFLESSKNDILFLRETAIFKNFLINKNTKNINEFFYKFMKSNKNYIQVKFIDKNGFEKINLHREKLNKQITTSSIKNSQVKSQNYYYKNSKNKEFGKVWFSSLDFSRKNHKATQDISLSAVLPIKNKYESFEGILVIDIFAKNFFDRFTGAEFYDFLLFNNSGEILYSKNKDDIFFKKNISLYFKKDYKEILSNSFLRKDDFIFTRVDTSIEDGLNLIIKVKQSYIDKQNHLNLMANLTFVLFVIIFFSILFYFILKIIITYYQKITEYQKILFEQSLKTVDEYILYSKTDLEGTITQVSEGFCKLSGYTQEELIGKNHNIIRDINMNNSTFLELWNTIRTKQTWKGTIKNKTKNGDSYFIETNITPDFDQSGKHIGYVSIRKDVTLEKLFKKQHTYLETILDTSSSIIISCEKGKLKNINKRFFEIFDFKDLDDFKMKHKCISELFIDKEDFYIMPFKNGKNWLSQLETKPVKSTLNINKVCMLDKKGDERHFQIESAVRLNEEDKRSIVLTLTEITILLKNRSLLKEQTKHTIMGEMIAMIAHQWRQPLTTLDTINTKLVVFKKMGVLTDSKLFDSIDKSKLIISHLSQTIDDFKNYFHKDEAIENINLFELVEKSRKLYDITLRKDNIEFTIDYNDLEKFKLFVAPSKITQVLLSLLKNSHDAIHEKKPHNKFIKIDFSMKKNSLFLLIADSAGGIPENIIKRIFEPYFSTKSKNGTGLGLYMTKMIIEDHLKGRISVNNTLDGALFTIEIPINQISRK